MVKEPQLKKFLQGNSHIATSQAVPTPIKIVPKPTPTKKYD